MPRSRSLIALGALTLLFAVAPAADAHTQPATPGTEPDFAGLVDIGGRKIYLECSGQGSPTVVLVAGSGSSARYWTDDLLPAAPPRTMVFPQVATTTASAPTTGPARTPLWATRPLSAEAIPSPNPRPRWQSSPNSTPCCRLQASRSVRPRWALDRRLGLPDVCQHLSRRGGWHGADRRLFRVSQAHLRAGAVAEAHEVQRPRLPRSCRSRAMAMPRRFLTRRATADMRHLTATSPLRPMPLAVLAHGRPFDLPKDPVLSQGFTSKEIEPLLLAANKAQAELVPDAALLPRERDGHDIHQDQPALTVEAIRQVVAGVRSPDTWYELTSCCKTDDDHRDDPDAAGPDH